MRPLPRPTEYSVFLDATELHSTTAYVTTPSHVKPSLKRISYYVSRLTVEERAVQLRQEFVDGIMPRLKQFSRVIAKTRVEPDLIHFREQITADLRKVPNLTVFDPIPHGILEQKLLFEARHQGAYKDAIIFASATAYAKANSLPRCSFVTQDKKGKGFPELAKTLSSIYPMNLMRRDDFKNMLRFDADLYDNIISCLQSKFEDRAKLLWRELVKRAQFQPRILSAGPEVLDFIERLQNTDPDLSSIVCEVRNIAIGAIGPSGTKIPSDVACNMSVRYSIADRWARLYWASASATLAYSTEDKLVDTLVTDFDLEWMPYA
jgi:hypothetical protein